MNKTKLAQMVNETMNSLDAVERAAPAPFLLTRINARLNRPQVSVWERISLFIARPGIALAAVAFVIIINLLIYNYSNSAVDLNNIQNMQAYSDEYSINNSPALFDLENIQP